MSEPVAFVCVNVGPRYAMAYVEILRDMVLRNASCMERPCAWFCITDRPDELPEGVNAIPADPALPGYWQKVRLFSPDMPWAAGQRAVYLDLDVAITGRLEDLVERKGIAQDAGWPCVNSSVMVWDHGEHRDVWERFTPEVMTRSPGPIVPARLLAKHMANGGDQEWITEVGGWETFPREWCVSYKWQAKDWPPNESKVVIFHGDPKPDAITTGWVPNVWKVNGFTSLPLMTGVNTTEDLRMANIRSSIQRDLPWFTGFEDVGRTVVLVCGAPSMRDHIGDIRWHARHGAQVISVNNAWRVLAENRITPRIHVMLDARPENVAFVRDAPADMRLFLASQCHPDVFDAVQGRDVVLWHNGFGDKAKMDALWEELKPWRDVKPTILVPGGCTVGLRALWLCALSGFRRIHLYGMDSSYADDGSHHAYPQPLNDDEQVLSATLKGRTYKCAPWMLRQANEFQECWRELKRFETPGGRIEPVTIHVHGRGLIPDIAAMLKAEEREAA